MERPVFRGGKGLFNRRNLLLNCIDDGEEQFNEIKEGNNMITIHWDFSDGTEVSYYQGKLLGNNFTTHCLDFFNMDEVVDDVVILRRDGKKISRKNIKEHSLKEIRKSHNIHKMLVSGSFNWL